MTTTDTLLAQLRAINQSAAFNQWCGIEVLGAQPGRAEIAVLIAAVALVFVSRLYLQVHFPSDVAAGAVLATLWVLFLRRLPAWRGNAT